MYFIDNIKYKYIDFDKNFNFDHLILINKDYK